MAAAKSQGEAPVRLKKTPERKRRIRQEHPSGPKTIMEGLSAVHMSFFRADLRNVRVIDLDPDHDNTQNALMYAVIALCIVIISFGESMK